MDEALTLRTILELIKHDPQAYQNYMMLGACCDKNGNYNQAYLCYENAVFLCQDNEKISFLKEYMTEYHKSHTLSVTPLGIVIGTYNNLEYNKQCIESIRKNNLPDSYHIVVVDNNSNDGTVKWLADQPDLEVIYGDCQYGFPKAYNLGMKRLTAFSDILLLNNDTVTTPNALFCLRMTLYASDQTGAAGAMTNCMEAPFFKEKDLNNPDEYVEYARTRNIPILSAGEPKAFLSGFALAVKSKVIEKVGYLDEYFSPGYYEDNDYCYRILKAGYQLVASPHARIFHYISRTFGTKRADQKELYHINKKKFLLKWHFQSLDAGRDWSPLRRFLPRDAKEPLSILHIGCGLGSFLMHIRHRYPSFQVTGAESNPDIADITSRYLPLIPFTNERVETAENDRFDYIFITDTLEYLKETELFIINLKMLLKENGSLIVTVDNSLFFPSLAMFLSGETSKRGFPLSQLLPLFTSNGFQTDSITGTSITFDKQAQTSIHYLQSMFGHLPSSEYSYQNYFIKLSLASEESS